MKMIRKIGFFSLLVAAALFAQNAGAIPVGGVLYESYSGTFDTGFGLALVDCEVYEYTSGEFIYTYQIFNNSTIGFSFFSVGIPEGADAWSPSVDSDPITGWVDPVFWTVAGSPVQSVDYLFADTIDYAETSALLWFVSSHPSNPGLGTLFGRNVSTTGEVLTPVPEPATFVLLGTAGIWILTRKRRSALKNKN